MIPNVGKFKPEQSAVQKYAQSVLHGQDLLALIDWVENTAALLERGLAYRAAIDARYAHSSTCQTVECKRGLECPQAFELWHKQNDALGELLFAVTNCAALIKTDLEEKQKE